MYHDTAKKYLKFICNMEKIITIKKEYGSLEKLLEFLKLSSGYDCSLNHDKWNIRRDENGQIEQCLLIKKSGMHGLNVYFLDENTIEVHYTIPNMLLHAYFGKSQKQYRRIDEIILGKVRDLILIGSQKKAFNEMIEQSFEQIIA